MTRLNQERGVQMESDQLPITAIVRCPLLAVRWQVSNNKIRRIQMRFNSDKDFDTAFNHLLRLGLYMGGQKAAPPQSKATAAPPSPAQGSSSQPNPTTVAYPEQPTRGPVVGGLSCPPSRLAEISSRPYTSHDSPASLGSQPHTTPYARPVSAATGYTREESGSSASFSGPLAPPVFFARPTSATSDILGRSHGDPTYSSDQHMPDIQDTLRTSTERPETAMLFNRPSSANRPGSASRPDTAYRPDSAEALPPRRELPFPRLSSPRSSGSDGVRPSTGTMGPPPLPSRVASGRPGSSRSAASKEIHLPPLPQPTVISKTARGKQAIQQPPQTPNQDHDSPQRARTSPHGHIENQPALTSSPISSPLSFNRSSSNAAHNLHTMSYNGLNTPPTSVASHRGASVFNPSAAMAMNENDQLAAYALQPDEGRRAALNEFVYRHLESDDFLTLVQDMETAWARVALGMQ
jgi:hypothetical protein